MDTLRPTAPARTSGASRGARGPVTPRVAAAVRLPATPAAARLARQHVRSLTGGEEDPGVAVVVSELVTNAVVHAGSAPQLRAAWIGGALRIEVGDDGPGHPLRRPLTGEPVTSGRGLALVEALSEAWGVDPAPTGKTVWALVRPAAP